MRAREYNGKQVFDGSHAMAQFIARRCKFKETTNRIIYLLVRIT